MAGVRAVGGSGRGLGSSHAGSAGRRSCVRVGIRCSPPAVRGDPVARGVRGRALSLLRLPSSWGLPGPAVHVLWLRLCGCGGPALSPWPTCPVGAACRGGGWGPSPGGWPAAVVRGVWCQVLSLSRRPGFRDPCVPDCGSCVRGDPAPASRPAPFQALAEGCPRRARLSPLRGASGVRHSPSATHVLWARVCGRGGPALCRWLACPVRGVWCQALSLPRLSVLGGRQPGFRGRCVPGALGAGVGAQHRPHNVRPCGPALRAVGLAKGCPRRRAPFAVVRGVRGQAHPLPRLPALRAGCRGAPPTCCGRGCAGVGAQHSPLGLHALWGLRGAGVVDCHPQGGWPATVVRGVWCQALSLCRPAVLWGGQSGFRDPCVPGAVGAGVETRHRPHSVRPCRPALLAVGLTEGRARRRAPFAVVRGV